MNSVINLRRLFSGDRVALTAACGMLVQVGRPLIALITLPILLASLGLDGLGIWMIALSLMSLVNVLGLGLSASVITAIGRAGEDQAGPTIAEVTSAAVLIAALWGAIVLAVIAPIAWLTDWGWLLGLTDAGQAKAAGELMVALSVLLGVSLIAVVPRQIMVGRLHGYLAHLFDFAGAVLGAAALVAGIYAGAPLWVLGIAFTGPSFILVLLGGLIYLSRSGITFFALRNLKPRVLRQLAQDSLRMAGYQSAYAVSSHSDLFLIGMILGTPASAAYGLARRIFSLPVIFGETINHAQWPALARADAAGDRESVAKVFRWTLFAGSSLALAMAVCMALAYEFLIDLWLGREVPTDAAILYGMVAWVLVATLANTCDSVLRAWNETAFLLRSMVLMAAINLPLTLLLLPVIGPAGAIWGTVTGYTLALLLPYLVRLRSLLSVR